ncbi:MAG TPA: ABC transporter substrate-binding protein [Thermoanaerobaculia bacterium]|nr:ABC transporter substrate-binding protein [Thermoanaerobaculia bacterium]
MKMRRTGLLALALGAAAAVGCAPGRSSKEIVVGEYGSLTGNTATFGQSTKNGSEMAFDEINKAGGLLGKPVKLIVEDDQSKPEEAATAVTKLINQNAVQAVLGEVASSRSLAAAPICQGAKVPMVTPSSTNPKVTQVGDYIFRVCFTDVQQGEADAKFAAKSLKLKKAALLYDVRNDYSVGLRLVFAQKFKEYGGEIVAEQSYSEGDSDFRAQLTQLKSANPEVIYVPGYYTEVGTIARQSRDLGMSAPLLGGDGWDSPRLWEIGGKALNGCYFSNHYSVDDPAPAVQKFVADYKAKYGNTPDALAALGYDAARILADAMTRAKSTDGAKVRDALAQTKNYAGVTGTITIDKDRNAVKPVVMLKVQDGKFVFQERIEPGA